MKKKKIQKEKVDSRGKIVGGLLAMCLAVVLGFSGFALAQNTAGGGDIIVEGDYNDYRTVEAGLGGFSPLNASDSASGFTDVDITNDLRVQGEFVAAGTTTQGILTYDSDFSSTLTFDAGATTTAGGLVSIQNTGATVVCDRVELDISTAVADGGPLGTGSSFNYRVATSTSATGWTEGGGNLIASTTNATGTTATMDTVQSAGTGVAVAAQTFLWANGEYILGAFDETSLSVGATPGGYASSSAYIGQAGSIYISCHSR